MSAVTRTMLHTCTIERATITQDGYGEQTESWADHLTEQKCRLITIAERIATPGASLQVLEVYRLILPSLTDVNRQDRIKFVTFEDGATDGPYNVEAIAPRRDRRSKRLLSLDLEKID